MDKEKFMAYVWLSRPQYAIMAFLSACAGAMVATQGEIIQIYSFLAVGFLFWAILITAHPVNDYFDRRIDKIARPNAPLPAGDLTPEEAKKSVIGHYILAFVLIVLIPLLSEVKEIPLIIVALFGLFLTIIYSIPPIRMRKRGILKNFTVGLALPTAFLGGSVAFQGWAVGSASWEVISVLFLIAACSQMLADVHDVEGEKAVGVKTLPARIGLKNTFTISLIMGLLAALIILLSVFTQDFNIAYAILSGIVVALILMVYGKFLIHFDPEEGRQGNEKLLMGMSLYIVAVIIGSV